MATNLSPAQKDPRINDAREMLQRARDSLPPGTPGRDRLEALLTDIDSPYSDINFSAFLAVIREVSSMSQNPGNTNQALAAYVASQEQERVAFTRQVEWLLSTTTESFILENTTYDPTKPETARAIYQNGVIRAELIRTVEQVATEPGLITQDQDGDGVGDFIIRRQNGTYYRMVRGEEVDVHYRQREVVRDGERDAETIRTAAAGTPPDRAAIDRVQQRRTLQLTAVGVTPELLRSYERNGVAYSGDLVGENGRMYDENLVYTGSEEGRAEEQRAASDDLHLALRGGRRPSNSVMGMMMEMITGRPRNITIANLDLDRDGDTDQRDMARLRRAVLQFDADNDGVIERNEMQAFVEAQRNQGVDINAIARAMVVNNMTSDVGDSYAQVMRGLNAPAIVSAARDSDGTGRG